jgi:SAM-dependent methyltransferase
VLVVGGGDLGEGLGVLTADPGVELVETDVYLGPRVGVVCDAHALPFADGAFDGVVIQAVLEHLLDPVRAVAEIHRVLAPGGLVYAETPFMQQVHEGAYDFTRWTALGHRRLFRWFDELDSGVAVGPASALVWSVRYFARSLPRSVTMARVLDRVATLAVFWLKYLDRWLVSHPGAHDAASSVYFCGRRRDEPIGDDELVAGYRGTVRSAAATRGVTGST